MTDLVLTLPNNGSDEVYLAVMKALFGPNIEQKTMIDLCCYVSRLLRPLPFKSRKFVDIIERDFGEDQEHFVCTSALSDHPVFDIHYDIAICSDGIEHLTKDEGWNLLSRMDRLADRQVLFTPLDPWMMEVDNPHPESHKSLWKPAELPGYAHIVMPVYHPSLNIGAFFFWKCEGLVDDFARVKAELAAQGFQP